MVHTCPTPPRTVLFCPTPQCPSLCCPAPRHLSPHCPTPCYPVLPTLHCPTPHCSAPPCAAHVALPRAALRHPALRCSALPHSTHPSHGGGVCVHGKGVRACAREGGDDARTRVGGGRTREWEEGVNANGRGGRAHGREGGAHVHERGCTQTGGGARVPSSCSRIPSPPVRPLPFTPPLSCSCVPPPPPAHPSRAPLPRSCAPPPPVHASPSCAGSPSSPFARGEGGHTWPSATKMGPTPAPTPPHSPENGEGREWGGPLPALCQRVQEGGEGRKRGGGGWAAHPRYRGRKVSRSLGMRMSGAVTRGEGGGVPFVRLPAFPDGSRGGDGASPAHVADGEAAGRRRSGGHAGERGGAEKRGRGVGQSPIPGA